MTSSSRPLTAWGRSSRTQSRLWPIRHEDDATRALAAAGPRGAIARGYGRSYGDACLNDRGDVLDTTGLQGIRAFDEATGVLECAAGTAFADVMRACLPRGWMPATCPGTAVVSMGGAIANDVHGKNQHVAGSFGDHLDWFDLLLPDGRQQRVTREDDASLFAATVGGIGLTGIVLGLQFRLQRVPSNALEMREERVPDIDTFLERLQASEREYPYVVGWIDALSPGRDMGRGVLELARPAEADVRGGEPMRIPVPFEFPQFVMNRHTVGAFNTLYYHRVPRGGRTRRIHVERFLYPLDALTDWNRMYGRAGVYQFQCVVPHADGRRAIVALLEAAIRSRGASFLAVLKSMARTGIGMLSFPMPGFTLALDFPRRAETARLLTELQDIALDHGGRVYLAKDACIDAATLRRMYPRTAEFEAVLQRVDPGQRMQSDMARRLGLLRTADDGLAMEPGIGKGTH